MIQGECCCGQYLVWRRVRVAQVKTGARLNRRVATARLGRGPMVGTIIRPPDDRNRKKLSRY